jgi:hypothetical protein
LQQPEAVDDEWEFGADATGGAAITSPARAAAGNQKVTTNAAEGGHGVSAGAGAGGWGGGVELQLGQHVRVTVDVKSPAQQAAAAALPGGAALWEPAPTAPTTTTEATTQHSRSYTPVRLPLPLPPGTLLRGVDAHAGAGADAGSALDLLVKVYPTGKVSSAIDELELQETVTISPAVGGLLHNVGEYAHVCMVYGGTGIAPMLPIIKHIRDLGAACQTKLHVICCNRAVEDVILADQLDQFAMEPNCSVCHVLSNPPAGWSGGTVLCFWTGFCA